LVDRTVLEIKNEMSEKDVFVVATGGLANTVIEFTETIDSVQSFLTLDGLRKIFLKNK